MKTLAVVASVMLLLAVTGARGADAAKNTDARTPAQEEAAARNAASAAIQQSIMATLEARQVKGEWRDTFKIIGKAKDAFRKGDYATAARLANKARIQGELGKEQALSEKNADIPDYVK